MRRATKTKRSLASELRTLRRRVTKFESMETQLRQSAEQRELVAELWHLAKTSDDLHRFVSASLERLAEWAGCGAVAIRLRDGYDFPYYEARGFPDEFPLAGSSLCARDSEGQPATNAKGEPLLECMCGKVLSGRTHEDEPFFTPNGSFWTSDVTELLTGAGEAAWASCMRHRFDGRTFASVALVPLRSANETYGLLQMNDKRPGLFTADRVAVLESLANSFALALALRRTREALKDAESRLGDLKRSLDHKDIAIREVLKQIELEKDQIRDEVGANVNSLLLPTLASLRAEAHPECSGFLDVLERGLRQITSSFGIKMADAKSGLTPRELEICDMIAAGLQSKEIANLLTISTRTVNTHRNNVRKKLGISNSDINLTAYLRRL